MNTGRLFPLEIAALPGMLLGGGGSFRIEEYTDGKTFVVRAEVPGLAPDKDIKVSVLGDRLQIRIERTEERTEKTHSEFHYGSFVRTVQLPLGATEDGITAQYAQGILEVRVPIGGPATAGREIPVTIGK